MYHVSPERRRQRILELGDSNFHEEQTATALLRSSRCGGMLTPGSMV